MNEQKRYLDVIISDLETNLPQLRSCRKQFIERVEEIISKNTVSHNYIFMNEEKKLIGQIEDVLTTINNSVHNNQICIEEFIEYLARYCGYSITYLGLVINNMPAFLVADYFNRNVKKMLNIFGN